MPATDLTSDLKNTNNESFINKTPTNIMNTSYNNETSNSNHLVKNNSLLKNPTLMNGLAFSETCFSEVK